MLDSGTPVDLNEARTADRMILSDDVPPSDVSNSQNNQSHNPDSMICVNSSVPNGMHRRDQCDGRTKSFSIAFAIFEANEASKLPKSGGFSPRRAELNLEQLSPRRIEKRKIDEDVSRSSSKSKKLKPDSPLLIDLTNNDAALPIIDLSSDTHPGLVFINDKFKTSKFPYRARFLGIPQPRQQSEIPITSSRPASPDITEQRQGSVNFILSAEQHAIIAPSSKLQFGTILVRLRQTLHFVGRNRDVLRRSWEADSDLRCRSEYSDHVKLNECFRVIEDKTAEAIAMLQRQLWFIERLS